MRLSMRARAIFVLRIALSYMMTVWSRMSTVMSSATSTTNSENTISTFATLRFAGDALDPEEISSVLKENPTHAYKKGESYRPGPRSPEITGKTGVWFLSTKRKIQSNDVVDHLNALERIISPFGDQDNRLKQIREIMNRKNIQAHVTFFWRGRPGARHPSIPSVATDTLRRLPADIEADIDTEDC
jgi:Domain of unknown function (DUF4279)